MASDRKPTIECPQCQCANPPDKKYCGECGAALDLTKGAIDAYLDAHLAKRLEEVVKGQFGGKEVAGLTATTVTTSTICQT